MFLDSRMFSWVHSSVLSWGSDSPVREEWSTFNEFSMMSLPSAGTLSPASRNTMSPGTTEPDCISPRTPSLSTSMVTGIILRKLSMILSAWYSCTKVKTALRTTTPERATPIYR